MGSEQDAILRGPTFTDGIKEKELFFVKLPLDERQKQGQYFLKFIELKVYKDLTDAQLTKRIKEYFPQMDLLEAFFIAKSLKIAGSGAQN